MISVAFITCRKDCKLNWLVDSIRRQGGDDVVLIIVDFWNQVLDGWGEQDVLARRQWVSEACHGFSFTHSPPKPNVWNGPSRLTREHWFSAASQRNTALCLCESKFIAFVDDLSVANPKWLNAAREAADSHYIAQGAYKKVKSLRVSDGVIQSYEEYPAGIDSRWGAGSDHGPVPANGDMMYGCSVVMPVEALLTINGFAEDLCDGMGFEDVLTGIVLQNAGFVFKYDRRLLTLESEEDHHKEKPFRKDDWHMENGLPVRGGNGGSDKSHAALNIAKQSKYFPNSFGEGGIRELRKRILAGGSFPIPTTPDRDWFTGQLLSEL